ncbi:MAG: 4Fe-4S binding protein [Lachnospiraceae bacterium]|nr:4Fe-4S binding protein [Lachnospiraceae bacterium]
MTDPNVCILCMACSAACPEHARVLPQALQERTKKLLGALKTVRRENEFFILETISL